MSCNCDKSPRGSRVLWVVGSVVVIGVLILIATSFSATKAGAQDALSAQPDAQATPVQPPTARESFVKNCAACHGETGDGHGTTVLERPARSFKDGGFSYGNTPEAVLRTITHGIPGSLMPSFGAALAEADRKTLAAYVIALGPPGLVVEAQDTVMVVRDRALIARGKLPPIGHVTSETVRGLLVGLPSGVTFAYDIEDMLLLGVFSGDFADRSDWIGRGGTVLQPLGVLVRAATSPGLRVGFTEPADGAVEQRLSAHIVSTACSRTDARLGYDLRAGSGRVVARVAEVLAGVSCSLGSGWKRTFTLQRSDSIADLRYQIGVLENEGTIGMFWDAKFRFAIVAKAGSSDLLIVRELKDATSDARSIRLSASVRTVEWTIFELPGVVLPQADEKRFAALVRATEELGQ